MEGDPSKLVEEGREMRGRISGKICFCSLVSWIELNEGNEGFCAIDKMRLAVSLRRR